MKSLKTELKQRGLDGKAKKRFQYKDQKNQIHDCQTRVVVILMKIGGSGEGEHERFAEKYYKKLNDRFQLCFQIIKYYDFKKFLSCIECPNRAENVVCIDIFIASIHCNTQAGRAMQR